MTTQLIARLLEAMDESFADTRDGRALIAACKEALAAPQCKYGNAPASCTSSPMDCQCALDAALAAPQGEPVAWMDCFGNMNRTKYRGFDTPLYTHPAPAPLTHEAIRAAGGIVHSDGNIFFTNLEKLNSAIERHVRGEKHD